MPSSAIRNVRGRRSAPAINPGTRLDVPRVSQRLRRRVPQVLRCDVDGDVRRRHCCIQTSIDTTLKRRRSFTYIVHCGGCEVQTSRSSTTVHNRSPQSDIYYYRHGCTLVESARWGCAHGSGEHILTEAPWSGHTDKITADNLATSAQTTFP